MDRLDLFPWWRQRVRLRRPLHKQAGEVLAIMDEQNDPQYSDQYGYDQSLREQQQVKQKDVHNHRTEQRKRERHVAVHKQKRAARNLHTAHKSACSATA